VENAVRMGEMINACKILVGKPKGRDRFEGLNVEWEDNTKMNLK